MFPVLEENDDCESGDVRLQDGLNPSNGRLEICQYRTWGAVCTNKWDRDDAKVVCRQLGYDDLEGWSYALDLRNFFQVEA